MMPDYPSCTAVEIASIATAVQDELGAAGISADDIIQRMQNGRAAIEARQYGFAVIELTQTPDGHFMPHLWLLYIDPAHRGKGYGRQFVRELLAKYSTEFFMSLYCYGSRRRAFFGRLGFRIESKDGEHRRMTTNPQPRR